MRQVWVTLLFLCVFAAPLAAQPVITPRNIALGGGGSTYITDFNANFYNPANLMIQDREGTISIGVGIAGFYFGGVKNYSDPEMQWNNSQDYIGVYEEGNSSFTGLDRADIIEENFPGNTTLSNNTVRYDATLLGMKWKRENHSFSLAFRTRTSSNFRVGRGWYSNEFVDISNSNPVLDRSLIHRYQTLHEVSFGYAESFQFLTGLTPRLDNFIIGIAPKLVLGGSYQNAQWDNVYERQQDGSTRRVDSFSYDATGEFGASTISYLNGMSLSAANAQSFNNDVFSLDGLGAGLDIGVTYLITLGSDLSAVKPNQQPTQRSLRLSFSMTDIGFISYNKNETSITATVDTALGVSVPSNVSDEFFIGAKGQYLDFIEKYGEDNPFLTSNRNNGSFSTLLPMALHGGALLEINRIKVMGDVSIGLTNNAFNSTKLISSFGMEISPFKFLPLRGGIQLDGRRIHFLSLGTAIETKKWDFSVAAQLTPNSLTGPPEISGISVATLQFHF